MRYIVSKLVVNFYYLERSKLVTLEFLIDSAKDFGVSLNEKDIHYLKNKLVY